MAIWRQSLIWKIALPVPLSLLAMIGAIGWIVPERIDADAQATAVENALQTVAHFRSVRDYYNEAVVPKIRASVDLKATHLHASNPKGPIPTTFILDMSDRLQNRGVSLHLVQPLPFSGSRQPQGRCF